MPLLLPEAGIFGFAAGEKGGFLHNFVTVNANFLDGTRRSKRIQRALNRKGEE